MAFRSTLRAAALILLGTALSPPVIAVDASAGAEIYQTTCKACHEISIAPTLAGVVGRPVASVEGFAGYSQALQARADSTWTPEALDAFLAAPADEVPGTLMLQAVEDGQQRADLIAFLTTFDSEEAPTSQNRALALADQPIQVAVRRLTESEYRNAIADLFGPDVEINARFEPERREAGLLAIGNAELSLTSSGFEQYFALGRAIADQVLDAERRDATVGCQPADPARADAACAGTFVERYGRRLFRRPLSDAERATRVELAADGANRSGDFYEGIRLALTSLLVAPEFLFRVETAEPDPEHPGSFRLDGYSKAARLSFLFWNAAPDDELLAAAGSGRLHTRAGLQAQIDRLVASPRYEQGLRAFFADMLQLDGFDNLIKDPAIYPKFNQAVADSAREEMLRTVVDLLLEQRRDYRDLFTARETHINRPLASVYQVPFASSGEWARYAFEEASGRSGVLTQIGFLSLFAHPGTSSPTRRGIKIHEIFMCEPTPDPPADVDFSKVKDSAAGTVRGRLLDHMENTGCVACHRRSDPPGLALEHFDGLGQVRRYENGTLIDVSATLNGQAFEGAPGLGRLLREDPRVPACLVRNVYAYSAGLEPGPRQADFLADQAREFAGDGFQVPGLMERMAAAAGFFDVVVPDGVAARPESDPAATVAQGPQ